MSRSYHSFTIISSSIRGVPSPGQLHLTLFNPSSPTPRDDRGAEAQMLRAPQCQSLVRLIPDELIHRFMHQIFPRTHASYIKISSKPRFRRKDTIENVRDELGFFKSIRGRHWSDFFTFQGGSRTPLLSSEDVNFDYSDNAGELTDTLTTRNSSPSREALSRSTSALAPATVMAGVSGGSVAGWNPQEISSTENDSLDAL